MMLVDRLRAHRVPELRVDGCRRREGRLVARREGRVMMLDHLRALALRTAFPNCAWMRVVDVKAGWSLPARAS